MQASQTTVDPAEVAKFEAMAAEWWDPKGKFKPLHMLNPCRLDYITSQIAAEFNRDLGQPMPFTGLRLLDIGCGGGLLSEPMARLGATVVGADAAERNIPVAQVHAEQSGLNIDYRHTTAEALAEAGDEIAATIYARAGRMLGLGIANLVNIFDPPLVVLAGERIRHHHLLVDELERTLAANALSANRPPLDLRVHRWGDELWARGAGSLAIDCTFGLS